MDASPSIFAEPRLVTDLSECHFYHVMDIPGFGTTTGLWDLRDVERVNGSERGPGRILVNGPLALVERLLGP